MDIPEKPKSSDHFSHLFSFNFHIFIKILITYSAQDKLLLVQKMT